MSAGKRHRRSIRLAGCDYSGVGAYFATVCSKGRACLFGDIADGKMVLNDVGRTTEKCWLDIPAHFPHAELDEFIVMPNHVHGIVVIADSAIHCRGERFFAPTGTNNTTLRDLQKHWFHCSWF